MRRVSFWRLEREGSELSHTLAASASSSQRRFSAMSWLPSQHPPPPELSFSSLLALGFTDGFVDILRFQEKGAQGALELLHRIQLSPGGLAVCHLLGIPSDGLKRMVAGTARALYMWQEKEPTKVRRSTEHESEIAGMAGDGLFSKIFTLSKAGVVRVWLMPEEASGDKWPPLLQFDCRRQQQQQQGDFGFRALGIAASFHGTHIMFVGRRVTSDKGRQTLTFPSGVESFVRTVRVPGYVEAHAQRLELFVQVCRYMHESATPAARQSLGDVKVTETFKWWWDLEQLARKEVKQRERALIVEALEEERKQFHRSEHEDEHGAATQHRSSPLHLSCKNGNVWISNLLVLLGSDVNARDKNGCTPLSLASFNGSQEIVRCLLDHRANVGAADSDNLTALHWASARGHRGIVELLLQHSPDMAGRGGGPSVLEVAHEMVKDLILAAGGACSSEPPPGRHCQD
uniref:Uncharacterized protein n=2 Tax=Guillardia theta TaxID=55529 RepID=A0A7S4KV54_GUITH